MDKFVKVGRHCIRMDAIDYIDEDPADVTVFFYGARTLTLEGMNAVDMRYFLSPIRQAREIVADREMDQAPGYGELLTLVKDAAKIIKAYDDAWVGHVDSSDTLEWLVRASSELGVSL